MKMMYNGIPIKSLNIKHYEIDTNSCDMIASDLQAGKTAVARGKKITGTGKSFEFAMYGMACTNIPIPVGGIINVIQLSSTVYPIVASNKLSDINNVDFSISQIIGHVTIDNVVYPISAVVENGFLTVSCNKSFSFEIFYGKDNYA